MALSFLNWRDYSGTTSSVEGALVTALPWSTDVALFLTDAVGIVQCAAANVPDGLTGSWTPLSHNPNLAIFATVPGAPVSVLPWSGHFAFFVTDPNGQVWYGTGDPQHGLTAGWAAISDGFEGIPGGLVTAVPWGSHIALFATDNTGIVRCAGFNPHTGLLLENWAAFSNNFSTAHGAPLAALPYDDSFAVFGTDASGGICYALGDPQVGLYAGWTPISDTLTTTSGAPVTVLPWGNHFALFATDRAGTVRCAGAYAQTGLMGTWAQASTDFAGAPGGAVAAIAVAGSFALAALDSTGAVRVTTGDPQNGLAAWAALPGVTGSPGAAVTIISDVSGVDLFTVADSTGSTTQQVMGTASGKTVMTGFTARQHGWHFDNAFTTPILGGVLSTQGLCGGMAYSALDYYFAGLPIPTHRIGDFGDEMLIPKSTPQQMPCPPAGRLHTMIYNRLIDSFTDNFGKWACIFPELYTDAAAALGLVVGGDLGQDLGGELGGLGGELGGFLGGLVGGLIGLVPGDLLGTPYAIWHELFDCPGDGLQGMTRDQLPHLLSDHLDKGTPVPIGLVYDTNLFDIGDSHQVVAYGYSVAGSQTLIYVYDNRIHDLECMLTIDTRTWTITETLTNGDALPGDNNGTWGALLVEDGYTQQVPSYGADLVIASPPVLALDGKPVATALAAFAPGPARASKLVLPAGSTMPIVVGAQPVLPFGQQLEVTFTVRNLGEWPSHYQSLGLESDPPSTAPQYYHVPATRPAYDTDTVLAPGDTATVIVRANAFGSEKGLYLVWTGYNTVPADADDGSVPASYWLRFFYPPTMLRMDPGPGATSI